MNKKIEIDFSSIIIVGLIVLFWNFGDNSYDLYDCLTHSQECQLEDTQRGGE